MAGTVRSQAWLGTVAVCCAIGVALAAPEWVPRELSREDGVIEWATFACLAVASGLAWMSASRLRPVARHAFAAVALGVVLFVAAGEEISWGQRLIGIETPAVLVDGNCQDELNLHNLEGLQSKAVLAQLAVAGGGAFLPFVVHRSWARAGAPLFAGYLAYRGGRGVAAVAGWGVADRNSEAAELLLASGLLVLTFALLLEVGRPVSSRSPVRVPVDPPDVALG